MTRQSELAVVALPTSVAPLKHSHSLWTYFYGITTPDQLVASLTAEKKDIHTVVADELLSADAAFRLARLALRASALYDRVVEHHPPRSNIRDFCRYLLVFRCLLRQKLAQPDVAAMVSEEDAGTSTPRSSASPGGSVGGATTVAADEAVSWTSNTQVLVSGRSHRSQHAVPQRLPPPASPLATTAIHGVPEAALLLPSASHTAMMLGALRAVSEVQGLVRRVFRALAAGSNRDYSASGVEVSTPAVRYPVFRSFLRAVVTVIGGYALEALGGGERTAPATTQAEQWLADMEEATDAHIVDAVVRGEWWRLRAGALGLPLVDFSNWLMSTLVLFTASDRHGDGAVADSTALLSEVFVPLAEKLGAGSAVSVGHTTGALVAGNDAGDSDATCGLTRRTSSQRQGKAPRRVVDSRSPPQRRGNDAVVALIPQFASLRPGRVVDPEGRAKCVAEVQPELVENMTTLLSHRNNKSDDDLTAQLLHRGAVRLMDGYPMRLAKPQLKPAVSGTPVSATPFSSAPT